LSFGYQEASIADISFLFDEGALVDFEIDELVALVQALFADTPLRTTATNKFLAGHPVQVL
jgi:centromere/kinetochore protein ZW10